MNVTKIISTVAKMTGTKFSATYNKEVLKLAAQKTKGGAVFLENLKNPFIDVAAKSSKNGYTIGAFRIRDGKEVIAKGAVSATGIGTPKSVIKCRYSLGDKGKAASANAFVDNHHNYNLADMEVNLSRKGGMVKLDETIGKAAQAHLRVNEKETAGLIDKMLGRSSGSTAEQVRTAVNEYGANGQNIIKKFLNGQEPTQELDYFQKIARIIQDFV